MKKILLYAGCVIVLIALLSPLVMAADPVYDQEWTIYVRNRELQAPFQLTGGRFFVPLSPLLDALKYSCSQGDDGVITINSTPGATGGVTISGGRATFAYGDNKFSVNVMMTRGENYVELATFARNIGLGVVSNNDTGIVDVVVPQGISAKDFEKEHNLAVLKGNAEASEADNTVGGTYATIDKGPGSDATSQGLDTSGPKATTAAATGAGPGQSVDQGPKTSTASSTAEPGAKTGQSAAATTSATTQKGKEEESPIKQVGDLGGFADTRTWNCWWNATLKNTGEDTVNNVIVTLHIQDGYGKDFDTQIKPIGNMRPGDISKVDFTWMNKSRLNVFPKLEIKHDPLPKKEETPAGQQQVKPVVKPK
ncbi:MAG: hypothetical protein RDV48_03570 [Candidatus Eremiobacteraeota bacterium]|nr:hypothetical protein [Candidatus Eremiobacteraeota bacterium]